MNFVLFIIGIIATLSYIAIKEILFLDVRAAIDFFAFLIASGIFAALCWVILKFEFQIDWIFRNGLSHWRTYKKENCDVYYGITMVENDDRKFSDKFHRDIKKRIEKLEENISESEQQIRLRNNGQWPMDKEVIKFHEMRISEKKKGIKCLKSLQSEIETIFN